MFDLLTPVPIRFASLVLYIVGGLIGLWISTLVIWLYMMRQLSTQSAIAQLRYFGGRELVIKLLPLLRVTFEAYSMQRKLQQRYGPNWKLVGRNSEKPEPKN